MLQLESFDAESERRYLARQAEVLAQNALWLLLTLAIGIVAFSAWDYLIDPAGAGRAAPVRLAGGVIITSFALWLWRGPHTIFRYRLATWASAHIGIATIAVAILMLNDGLLFGLNGILVPFIALGLVQVRVRDALALSASLATILSVAMLVAEVDHKVGVSSAIFIGLAAIAVWLTSSTFEYASRRSFVLDQKARREARTDPLTGSDNRRRLEERSHEAFARCRAARRPLSVVIIDLDHFKGINDRYGHDAGDAALRAVADACGAGMRRSDCFARYGGEEFAALLPGMTLEEATQFAERLRGRIERLRTDGPGGSFGLTASFGVASLADHHGDWKALFSAADNALYRAKRSGRNRVVAID
jgi:diguanylate cyclase (GGDEF)-like protein